MEEFIPLSSNGAAPKKGKKANKFTKGKKGKKAAKGKKVKNISKLDVTEEKPTYKMRLLFQEPCPAAEDVRKLHPLIQYVFIPRRPASGRFCNLKFNSAEELEEVRSFLHKKHIEPFKGILRCYQTQYDKLREIKMSNPELLNHEYLTRVDIKHAKFVHNEDLRATLDVKHNSTARELFVRYGVGAPFISKIEKQNGMNVSSVSIDEDDEDMDDTEAC